jgi:hypothetical protein
MLTLNHKYNLQKPYIPHVFVVLKYCIIGIPD